MAIDEIGPLFQPGQRLGRYQPLRRIAVGGMAELYLARATGPGDFRKIVALKRLLPQHALEPQLLRMFLDEARLMARMSHPHIPQVYDVDDGAGVAGAAPGVPYFAMEYVHGTDLRSLMNAASEHAENNEHAANEAFPLSLLVAVGIAVASGLHHAHELRSESGQPLEIVHRDISPSNVLVGFDGTIKVSDFGVAKWRQQRSLTYQGQLKGKFAHMSPEQCRGLALDRRSDVFALGTLLYEMATGRAPFVAESDYQLLSLIVSRDVTLPETPGRDIPPELASIILRTLKRDRDERYATAQAVQLDLEQFAREHKLVVSQLAVAEQLEAMLGARVTEWRDALKSGRNLAEHLEQSLAVSKRPRERTATDTQGALAVDAQGGEMSADDVAAGIVARGPSEARSFAPRFAEAARADDRSSAVAKTTPRSEAVGGRRRRVAAPIGIALGLTLVTLAVSSWPTFSLWRRGGGEGTQSAAPSKSDVGARSSVASAQQRDSQASLGHSEPLAQERMPTTTPALAATTSLTAVSRDSASQPVVALGAAGSDPAASPERRRARLRDRGSDVPPSRVVAQGQAQNFGNRDRQAVARSPISAAMSPSTDAPKAKPAAMAADGAPVIPQAPRAVVLPVPAGGAPSAAVSPGHPVKVWDPDSPVPP